jgi:hypothetical protein
MVAAVLLGDRQLEAAARLGVAWWCRGGAGAVGQRGSACQGLMAQI